MKKWIFLLAAFLLGLTSFGQNEVDALRYSRFNFQGTARSMAMGGAFGALGADLSTLSTNPAGLGIYRKSEFSFTPGIYNVSNSAEFSGQTSDELRSLLQFSNIGIAGSYPSKSGRLKYFNFAVGYNKLSSFQENLVIAGSNTNTTLLDVFQLQGAGLNVDQLYENYPFGAALAWDTYLLDPASATDTINYINAISGADGVAGNLDQRKNIERRGAMGETVLSAGANYDDKLFFGLSLAFPSIRFRENSSYTENNFDNPDIALNTYTLSEEIITTGSGFNIKAGMIYRASRWLRVGASIHSPSWLNLRDTYETAITSRFLLGDAYTATSPLGSYQYNLRTPARYQASAAFILGMAGVISADYEYVDYSTAKLRSSNLGLDDYDFNIENGVIDRIYRGTHNVRVGAEARLGDVWRVRLGANYQQSPIVPDVVQSNPARMGFSGGFGYRYGGIFADVAYVFQRGEADYYLYDPALVNPSTIVQRTHLIALTVGFRY